MVWLFDYDLTLYGRDEYEVLARLDRNITRFLQVRFGLSLDEADERRRSYWKEYGTTLAGLRARFGVEPAEYFDFIHAGDLLYPRDNPALRAMLLALPGQRWVFSNARCDWVSQGLRSMGIADCFEGILDIESFDWRSKPNIAIYPLVEERVAAAGGGIVFVDDRPENLAPGRDRGWKTVLVHDAPDHPPAASHEHLVLPRLLDLRMKADPSWFD